MSKALFKSTAIVGGLTLLSRIFGFARDVIIAQVFGASAAMDAFLVAFKIPNFMRRLFAEGAFSQAFIPVLSEYKNQQDKAAVQQLVSHTAGTLGGVLLLVTVLGVLLAPVLIVIFAPGFLSDTPKYSLAVDLLRITFPYLLFIALTAFAGSVLNTYNQFTIPAFTPVLLNICLITAAVYFAPWFAQPIIALAWGVFIAGLVQLLLQLPFLHRMQLLSKPQFDWHHAGIKKIRQLMLPALFGVSVAQINLLIDTLMASFLVTGSVSWLYYADRLMEFPLGVFGIALTTVALPNLSKTVAQHDHVAYCHTLDWALRLVLLVVTPAMLGLIWLAEPILLTLFHNGQFTEYDVLMSSYSLMAYALGLLGFVGLKVLAAGFFAHKDTRTPVVAATVAMVVNLTLNLALIIPLQHTGLALATAIAALVNAGLLFYLLIKKQNIQWQAGWRWLGLRIGTAIVLMTVWLWWWTPDIAAWLIWTNWQRAGQLSVLILTGAGVYLLSLFSLGLRLRHVGLR